MTEISDSSKLTADCPSPDDAAIPGSGTAWTLVVAGFVVLLVGALPNALAGANYVLNGIACASILAGLLLLGAGALMLLIRLLLLGARALMLLPLKTTRFWFWVVELGLVGAFITHSYVWNWWRHGERITGVVTAVQVVPHGQQDSEARELSIRDPDTEREVKVVIGSLPWYEQKEVGDTATAVVMRGDPTKVASPGDLQSYVVCWLSLPGLAALCALGWRRIKPSRTSGATDALLDVSSASLKGSKTLEGVS